MDNWTLWVLYRIWQSGRNHHPNYEQTQRSELLHLFISIHLELGVYIFAATCIYNGSLKFQIGIFMICQNVLIVYQNNLI